MIDKHQLSYSWNEAWNLYSHYKGKWELATKKETIKKYYSLMKRAENLHRGRGKRGYLKEYNKILENKSEKMNSLLKENTESEINYSIFKKKHRALIRFLIMEINAPLSIGYSINLNTIFEYLRIDVFGVEISLYFLPYPKLFILEKTNSCLLKDIYTKFPLAIGEIRNCYDSTNALKHSKREFLNNLNDL